MQVIRYPERSAWKNVLARPALNTAALEDTVSAVLREVKEKGDTAVRKYTLQFDQAGLDNFEVGEAERARTSAALPEELKAAIRQAKENIERFHAAQVEDTKMIETMPGVKCWRKAVAVERPGLYIPGGTAPLFSTILMLAVPASLAGCREIVLCTPPDTRGQVHPAILYTAELAGVSRIFKIGGVQAIAAMAYGTETVPAVGKIFGPGNQYVTCAKQLVNREGVAIDMPAGPSEVAVLADESAIPSFVAADLLSQAEHGTDSQVLLVTDRESLVEEVLQEIGLQLNSLPRKAIAEAALKNSKAVVVRDPDTAIELINAYAPEHLIISWREALALSEKILNAGSVFIGNYSPESVGDYASGTNHTLPTNGYAKAYSGVSVDSFVKKITYQQLTPEGLRNIGKTVEAMAAAEGLDAHRNAVSLRLEYLKK